LLCLVLYCSLRSLSLSCRYKLSSMADSIYQTAEKSHKTILSHTKSTQEQKTIAIQRLQEMMKGSTLAELVAMYITARQEFEEEELLIRKSIDLEEDDDDERTWEIPELSQTPKYVRARLLCKDVPSEVMRRMVEICEQKAIVLRRRTGSDSCTLKVNLLGRNIELYFNLNGLAWNNYHFDTVPSTRAVGVLKAIQASEYPEELKKFVCSRISAMYNTK